MKQSSRGTENDFLLTMGDLFNILKKSRKMIFKSAVVCACIALVYGLTRPIEYRAEATFKEKGKSQSGLNQSLSALLLNGDSHESEALTLMRSRMIIEKLVKSLSLQATLIKKEISFPLPVSRIKNNILSEYANAQKLNTPLIAYHKSPVAIADLRYDGEIPLEASIKFFSDEDFKVESNKQLVGQGKVGVPFSNEQFSFTLNTAVSNGNSGQEYRLTLSPLGKTAQAIAKKFTIEPDRFDSSLIKIAYSHPDKYQAALHANTLMELYKDHTHQEHQCMCNMQIAYLQEKQAEMGKQLETLMNQHASTLSTDLTNTGFADYTAAMNFLTTNQLNYKQRLQAIDLEIYWLKQAHSLGKEGYDKFTSMQNPEFINQLIKDIRQLKHEAYSLELTLGKHESKPSKDSSDPISKNFQGIDLATAKELYLAYSKELNTLEAQEAQFNFIVEQIGLPNFEISSLSAILTDPISVEVISKASPLVLALKDQENRTQKEQERLKAGLLVHKEFFISHLGQTNQLVQLRQQLIKTKIEALQLAHLNLILEQIAILENQMKDYISQRLSVLEHEKQLFNTHLMELQEEMAHLPQKWVAEQMIHQKMEINQNLIEQISKLVESKNLASNLEKTQSTSVDLPLVPTHPRPPHLLLLFFAGGMLGAFFSSGWALAKSIGKGVGASEENLKIAGQHVAGLLSKRTPCSETSSTALLDSDLETLRRIVSFITSSHDSAGRDEKQDNSVVLLSNDGPNYADCLAEIMSKMGYKILVMDLCFTIKHGASQKRGLLQFFEQNKEPEIEHKQYCDLVHAGGVSRFSNEMLASEKFKNYLSGLQMKYDWVIAVSNAQIFSAEADTLLNIFAKAMISIQDESLIDLREKIILHSVEKTFVIIK
jgi:uncharacterized protein involved in exopolysaccharide biosynthesis